MKKLMTFAIALACAFALALPATAFAATSTSQDTYVGAPALTITLTSSFTSNESGSDVVNVTTSGKTITVKGHSTVVPGLDDKAYYRIKINPLGQNTKVVIDKKLDTVAAGDGWDFSVSNLDVSTSNQDNSVLEEGLYQVRIARAGALGSTPQFPDEFSQIFRTCILKLTANGVKVVNYSAIMKANEQARAIMDQWTGCDVWSDASLNDMKDLMRKQPLGATAALTSTEAKSIKDLAQQIVAAAKATTDYQKARALYDYVSEHFFWDEENPEGDNVVTSAYSLLMEANGGSFSTSNCGGFSVSIAAMSRAVGIPTRVVYGRHVDDKNWANAADLDGTNHHWVQMYIDGRWMDIDPFQGSSKVKKKGTGELTYPNTKVSGYGLFDPSPESFANGYILHGVYYKSNALPAPTSLTLKGGASSVTVSWPAVSGANEYLVYRSTSETGTFTKVGTVSTTSFTNTGLVPARKYYYKVKANDTTGQASLSDYSEIKGASADLSAPSITVTAGANSATVSWPAVASATSYKVYQATSKTGTYSLAKTVTSCKAEITGLTGGTTYYFKVKAVTSANSAADSAYSAIKSVTAKKVLKAPTLTMKGGALAVTVSWKAIAGADQYKVYRATSETGTFTLIKTTSELSFKNTGLVSARKYYYKVKAVDSTGAAATSEYSAVGSATADLAAPKSITAANGVGSINLAWGKVSNATSYKVYRATSKTGTYSLVKTTSSCKADFTGLTNGKTYYFKIKAVTSASSAADSAYSAVKAVVTKCKQPDITLTSASGAVTVKWAAATNAKEYKIYRATSLSGTYKLLKTTSLTSWKNSTGLTKGKTYYYKVKAVCKNGTEGDSSTTKVKSVVVR